MKKLTVIAMTVLMALAVVVPAMAVDVDFSGYYRVRGFWNSNILLNDEVSESEAYYDNRFRLQTVFKANDNVSVTTRFDALDDNLFGATTQNEGAIDWDRIYMDIKASFGAFRIGHQQGGVWGLPVFDDDMNADRIKFTTKAGDLIVGGIIQKNVEMDSDTPVVGDGEADQDVDVYYLFGLLKQETMEGGLLLAYANDAHVTTQNTTKYAFLPYWKLMFGPIGFQGEIIYETGTIEYDAAGADDTDIDALCYNFEGCFNLEMAKLYAGYTSVSGQDPDANNEFTMGNTTYGGLGDDWNPLAFLTDDLGGKPLNNPGDTSSIVALSGVDMWYLGADITVSDQLSVHTILAGASANEGDWADSMGLDDSYGMEFDLGVTYQIMDNLEYSATLAYLMADELLAQSKDVDDDLGMIHQIKASF
jgi:hypothetical protein